MNDGLGKSLYQFSDARCKVLFYGLKYCFTNCCFLFQSNLKYVAESRMEEDYKLVENEGLFQEYLEMGKLNKIYVDFFAAGLCKTNEISLLYIIILMYLVNKDLTSLPSVP